MIDSLRHFFWEDSQARRLAYAITAFLGILHATTRTLVFHRPERQVAIELFVLVLVLNPGVVALSYLVNLLKARRKLFVIHAYIKSPRFTLNQPIGPLIIIIFLLLIYKLSHFISAHIHITFLVMGLTLVVSLFAIFLSFRKDTASSRTYRLSQKERYGGLVACLILLSAPRLSISKVQAAIVNQRLERAASSIEPDKAAGLPSNQLKSAYQKIASIANTSIEYKIPANSDLVEKVKNNLEVTLKAANPGREDVRRSGVAAFIALVAYARFNNVLIAVNAPTVLLPHGETGNYMLSQVPLKDGAVWWQGSAQGSAIFAILDPSLGAVFPISHSSVVFNAVNFNAFGMRRAFVETDDESQVVIMNATIEGATQKLDAIVWLNIKFKNSQIIYSGGPLYLGDVTFENCQFQFGSDTESQKVLIQIKEMGNQPVTLVSGL